MKITSIGHKGREVQLLAKFIYLAAGLAKFSKCLKRKCLSVLIRAVHRRSIIWLVGRFIELRTVKWYSWLSFFKEEFCQQVHYRMFCENEPPLIFFCEMNFFGLFLNRLIFKVFSEKRHEKTR